MRLSRRQVFHGAAELALADLAFSGCGTRVYALARARTHKLSVYSLLTGLQLDHPLIEVRARGAVRSA